MPFQKGQSGNPGGRPLGRSALSDILDRLLEMSDEDLIKLRPTCQKEAIAQEMILTARGKIVLNVQQHPMIKDIFDRTEGRPEQRSVLVGDEFQPLQIVHVSKTNSADTEAGASVGNPDDKADT